MRRSVREMRSTHLPAIPIVVTRGLAMAMTSLASFTLPAPAFPAQVVFRGLAACLIAKPAVFVRKCGRRDEQCRGARDSEQDPPPHDPWTRRVASYSPARNVGNPFVNDQHVPPPLIPP